MNISVIVPIYNEEKNVEELYSQIAVSLSRIKGTWEVLFVNDGSTDSSAAILDSLAEKDITVKVIHLRRNFGQTDATMAGLDHSVGDIIITLDGDLQNDPADIPQLLDKLDDGYDVCSGWRKNRKDAFFSRTMPSKIANRIISLISGVHLHDYGCTLKAYKREIIQDVKLYGEMHRFIPIYASWQGARVTEIPVNHRPRLHGKSHYGIDRTLKVILDLMVIKFMASFSQKPIYIFGGFGVLNFFFSIAAFGTMIYYKYWGGKSFVETPIPLLVILFVLMGFLSVLMGFLAEVQMRTYYESQGKTAYLVKATRNVDWSR